MTNEECELLQVECRKWQSLVVEKSRELDLMTKVADIWQDKLIKSNERIAELEKQCLK